MKLLKYTLLLFIFLAFNCTSEKKKTVIKLNATENFTFKKGNGIAPFYADKKQNALAINAANYKNLFSAATTIFNGKEGVYDVTLHTLKETDGESFYKIIKNDSLIHIFQNPETIIDYELNSFISKNIKLKTGDELEIQFSSHSNGKIPEGNAFAFSRGRWQGLEIVTAE